MDFVNIIDLKNETHKVVMLDKLPEEVEDIVDYLLKPTNTTMVINTGAS